jgi:hypothetical protein
MTEFKRFFKIFRFQIKLKCLHKFLLNFSYIKFCYFSYHDDQVLKCIRTDPGRFQRMHHRNENSCQRKKINYKLLKKALFLLTSLLTFCTRTKFCFKFLIIFRPSFFTATVFYRRLCIIDSLPFYVIPA